MNAFSSEGRSGGSLKPVIIAVLAAFALGASLAGYLAWKGYIHPPSNSGSSADIDFTPPSPTADAAVPQKLTGPSPAASPSAAPTPDASATAAAKAVQQVAEQQGGIDQRLAAAEQRITKLDLQAQAAAGNAARAEGLLIAFATRRALERGAPLGYLEEQLKLRFGDAKPNSVQTIIEFSHNPVTLDVLIAQLQGLGPKLEDNSSEPFFTRVKQELSDLFVIRRETTPSPQPQKRLERARFFLESGRVDKAIGEVEQLPGAASAKDWIAKARRYERAQQALDLIETSAVREPRLLRDGNGKLVEQPSPADAETTPSN
ncbi:mitofilin family membrane protein [Tsuneonella mangrovi]|uniref:mitofilin family membrane protein n=1 Tax=Tsuneonella mangrovi TaxID=1982042 RepID=UPI000BA26B07|nr:mitofilin family membrane protein [Tsuneonella mangrovi]